MVSTSTRNFPNRLGKGANVYLASAELAAVSAKLGKLPTVAEYMEFANKIAPMAVKHLPLFELPRNRRIQIRCF